MTVGEIYDSVSELGKFNESGHLPNDTFNNFVNLAQQCLIDYYLDQLDKTHEISDSLSTFVKSVDLTSSTGKYDKPSDFYYDLQEVYFIISKNSTVKTEEPTRENKLARFLESNIGMTLENSIRGPSLAKGKLRYYYESNQIVTAPLHTAIKYRYVREPVEIVRAVTQNVIDFVEDYDDAGSTHPEWVERDKDNLVDLVLMYLN
jgi:hypothetical protein